jgi:hypothetical protein
MDLCLLDLPQTKPPRGGSLPPRLAQLYLEEVDQTSSATTAIPRSRDGHNPRDTIHVPPMPPLRRPSSMRWGPLGQAQPALTLHLCRLGVAAAARGGSGLDEEISASCW